MIKHNIFLPCLALLTLFAALLTTAKSAVALDNNYTIVCGTVGNKPVNCDMSTHRCYLCTKKNSLKAAIFISIFEHTSEEFSCLSRDAKVPRGCKVANAGGISGSSKTKILGLRVSDLDSEGQKCITSNLKAMYASTCYSCEIVETLSSAFIKAAAKAYQVSREAANAILVVASLLWVALYILKSVSSFTTVEPRKMIQDLMIQFFKIYLAFVIINSGIQTILHYTLEPIMNAGTDWGSAIISANTGVSANSYGDN